MNIKSIFAILLTLVLLAPRSASATIEVVRDPNAWDYAPLLYSDRVLRGTVLAISLTEVSVNALYHSVETPPNGSDFKVTRIVVTLRVLEVLRGAVFLDDAAFLVVDDVSEANQAYAIGNEMVVCMKYHRFLATYYQTGPYGRYLREGKEWHSEKTPRGQRSFTDAHLREQIKSMDLSHVSAEAELILQGRVRSVVESAVYGPDSVAANMVTVRLEIETVQKGTFAHDEIEVVGLTSGLYLPAWRKHIPRSFAIGQLWLCFLKKNEVGWYPFAGVNGLLRIEGNSLVYDERVAFWYSKKQVEAAIAETWRGEE